MMKIKRIVKTKIHTMFCRVLHTGILWNPSDTYEIRWVVWFFFAILDVVVSDIDVDLIFLATFIVLPQLPTSGGLT